MNDATMAFGGPSEPPRKLSRTEGFCIRLDAELAGMPAQARHGWLVRQLAVWLRRYEDWATLVDKGEPTEAAVDDYLDTISAIERRMRASEGQI